MKKKAPITALTVTGAAIRTAEAVTDRRKSIIVLLVAELKDTDSHGKRTRTAWIDDCRHNAAL